MYMRPQIVTILTFAVFFMNSGAMFGQLSDDANPPPPPQLTPIDAPIDGGIFILIILGIVYGVYALKQRQKRSLKNS